MGLPWFGKKCPANDPLWESRGSVCRGQPGTDTPASTPALGVVADAGGLWKCSSTKAPSPRAVGVPPSLSDGLGARWVGACSAGTGPLPLLLPLGLEAAP